MTKKEQSHNKTFSSKRRFLIKLWIALGFVALFEMVWGIISFLRSRQIIGRKVNAENKIIAGNVKNFMSGSVTAFPKGHFYLVCLKDGGFLALSRRCTHLGCTLPWLDEEKKFICPCHASTFDIKGDVIQSPAPRAMDLFRVSIENGVVFVDTSRSIKRSGFDETQVAYPTKKSDA